MFDDVRISIRAVCPEKIDFHEDGKPIYRGHVVLAIKAGRNLPDHPAQEVRFEVRFGPVRSLDEAAVYAVQTAAVLGDRIAEAARKALPRLQPAPSTNHQDQS